MKHFVLIDGNSLVHRGFHALPPLTTAKGELVNAVYGFTSMFLKIFEDFKPDYLCVGFDSPKPTFRHAQYGQYKAQRPKDQVEISSQFEKVKQVLEAFSVPYFEVPGYEADDLIGTLSAQVKKEDVETIIVSGDLDCLQLVDKTTKLCTPKTGITNLVIYGEKEVLERYGFTPKYVTDYKALRGDPSDNIPGVLGIGEKTAAELIKQLGGLEEIYKNLEKIPEKVRQKLAENAEQAKLSKELATIVRDAPIKLDLEACRTGVYDRTKVLALFTELGFRTLVKRLPETKIAAGALFELEEPERTVKVEKAASDYHLLKTKKGVEELAKKLAGCEFFSFNTETTHWLPLQAKLLGVSLSYQEGEAFYVPYEPEFLQILKPVFQNSKIGKIAHNTKYDFLVLDQYDVRVGPLVFDTQIAAYLLAPGSHALSLKNLAYVELGVMMEDLGDLMGKGKNKLTMEQIPLENLAMYSCADADMTLRLKSVLEKKLAKLDSRLEEILYQIELPLVLVLADMEKTGVLIDKDFLAQMSHDLEAQIRQTEKEIYSNVGHEFNINSPKQLAEVLFSELKLPAGSKTKTGYSTDEAVLQSLKNVHPVIEHLLTYRQLFKIKSTYVDVLPALINPQTGRLHTSFNQTATATGRLSSQEPNLQNIPIRGDLGAKIRQAFIAPKGHKLISADYSQIELRIMAHVSGDPKLREAFERDEDIHAVTAAQVFGVPLNKVTEDMRRFAKTINFGLMYGMGRHGLAQALGIRRHEAEIYIEKYFETYSRVKAYLEELLREAREKCYVQTLLGRRRFLPEICSNVPNIRSAAERMAINFPFQGSAADLIKMAMINISRQLSDNRYQTKMILQVHDELVFEVPDGEVKKVVPIIKKEMEEAMKLSVPIKVDITVGQNWGK